MKWIRDTLLKILYSTIDQIVQEALEKAVSELNEEIDKVFEDEQERATLKSGIAMLRTRAALKIRETL